MIDPNRLRRTHVANVSVKLVKDEVKATIRLAFIDADGRIRSAGTISWERWVAAGNAEAARALIQE